MARSAEHTALARAIHHAGTADPDALAQFLIREGWRQSGVLGTVSLTSSDVTALNVVAPIVSSSPSVQAMLAQRGVPRRVDGS